MVIVMRRARKIRRPATAGYRMKLRPCHEQGPAGAGPCQQRNPSSAYGFSNLISQM
jgi:hypothetical protein